jgi:small conductance mechanosensitive channel
VIETSEVVGVVESMGLRITRVRSDDGAIWYLRNGEILRVGNRSQGNYVPLHETADGTTDQGSDHGAAETKKTDQKAGE